MRNFIGILLLLAATWAQAQGTFVIKGEVKNVEDGTLVTLFRRDGDVGSSIGVDTIRHGAFCFRLPTAGEGIEELSLRGRSEHFPPMSLSIWVRPGTEVRVTGENTLVYTWKAESDLPEQYSWNAYVDDSRDLWEEFQRCLLENTGLRRSSLDPEARKQKADSLEHALSGISARIDLNIIRRMQETPVDAIWLKQLEKLARECKYDKDYPYREETIALYNRLTDEEKQMEPAANAYTCLFPPQIVEEGDEMPDADLYDLEGGVHHLADLKGKYILIDFWSRGCGPCIMALPEMGEVAELHKDRLAVVSLSIDTKQGWEKASQSHGMSWMNWNELKGSNGLYAKYGVNGIPCYVLISPEGRIQKKWMGYAPGLLKMTLKRELDRGKYTMSVGEEAGNKVVNYPTVRKASTHQLEVQKVVLSPETTAVHIRMYQLPQYWVKFDKGTHLETEDGKAYALLRAEGITPGEEFFMPESGEADVVLYFAPLPREARSVSLIEPGGNGAYRQEGIALTQDK